MMRSLAGLASVALLLAFTLPGDPVYPIDFFVSPVGSALRLSGTFGELRPNHFHAGIDIKGGIGVPILAAGDGFVSRIRVAPDGYGNHLYVQHPNGYTTVYAHLLDYAPEIQQYVRSLQFSEETFELDVRPEPSRFPVRRGQGIGRMGNTGHSFGPHLHFEIRQTESDKPLNPLLFGLSISDRVPPRFYAMKVYELDERGQTLRSRTLPLAFRNGAYRPASDTLAISSNRVAVAVKVYDQMDGVSNQNGVYSLDLFANDSLAYGFRMEGIGFDQTRALNAHLDYQEHTQNGAYFHRCFRLPGNQLGIYLEGKEGILPVQPSSPVRVQTVARDASGNAARLEFSLRSSTPPLVALNPVPPYQYFLAHDRSHLIDDYMLYLNFPKGTFYEDLYMQYEVREQVLPGGFSPTHAIHRATVPVHSDYTIGIRPYDMPEALRPKAFIAQRIGTSATNCGGQWQEDGMLVASVRSLGYFCVMVDTIPPTITPERFYTDMRRYNSFSFRIRDNFSGSANLPNLKYRAAIDGKWILMTYDEKYRRIEYVLEPDMENGTHTLELQVSDAMGNTTTFTRNFTR